MENETGGADSFVVSLGDAKMVLFVSCRSRSLQTAKYDSFLLC